MKKLAFALVCLLIVSISRGTTGLFAESNVNTAEIVMEVSTNRVLSESNARNKMFMASTTKILTAIVVIESVEPEEKVTVPKSCVGVEGSSIYLAEGEILTVRQLLFGLMLRSGNDCAETLALYVGGSIENFARLMNEKAKNIGATDSNFTNPHGLHDDRHYTTAYDLALISSYAIKNCLFKEIVSTKCVKIPYAGHDYERVLINKNKMLKEYEGATGIKTGFTRKAGRCLVTSCEKNGMELVSVVLNCAPMWERSKTILEDANQNYSMHKIAEADNVVGFVNNDKTDEECGLYIKSDIVLPLTDYEARNIEVVYDFPDVLTAPFDKDSQFGLIKIFCQNNLLFSQKTYTIIGVR